MLSVFAQISHLFWPCTATVFPSVYAVKTEAIVTLPEAELGLIAHRFFCDAQNGDPVIFVCV